MADNIGNVDASIPLQAGRGVQGANPLQQIGEFANASNALNQLKLFPGVQQLQSQAIQRGGVSNAQQINQAAYGSIAHLLALPEGGITHSALTSALGSAEASLGIPTHGVLGDLLKTAPSGDGPDFDRQVRSMILARTQMPAQAAGAVTPIPGTMNLGNQIIPTMTTQPGLPGGGTISQPGAGFRPGLTPSESVSQVGRPVTGEEATRLGVPPGTIITETLADRLTQQGAGGALTPGRTPVIGAPGAFGPNGGRLAPPPALLNPNRQPAAPAPATGGPVVSGMAPGEAGTMEAQVGPAQAMAQRVSTFQSDMFPLNSAQQALANAPTGKGSEAVHAASSYINTFAPEFVQKGLSFISPLMSKDEVAQYDEARKYLTQSQLGVSGAGRSDQGLTTAGAASPSTTISKEAAQIVLKGMIALRRMEQDEGQSWIASGQPASKLNAFRADFQKQADPRVYTFDQMTPAQRRETLNSFFKDPSKPTDAEISKQNSFKGSVSRAVQNGVLAAP